MHQLAKPAAGTVQDVALSVSINPRWNTQQLYLRPFPPRATFRAHPECISSAVH